MHTAPRGWILAALAGWALTGCQPTESSGVGPGGQQLFRNFRPAVDSRTAVYNMEDQPREIDPATNTTLGGGNVIQHVFEGLTFTGRDEAVVPGVAERWEISEDGLTYDFQLRENAKWSDGRPVTARDFQYAWTRVLTPETGSQYANLFYAIEGAEAFHRGDTDDTSTLGFEAVTDHHFRVRLARPVNYFLQLTAFPTFFPVRQDVIEADPEGWSHRAETYIGNGAFRMTVYERSHKMEFGPNPHWWSADTVGIDRLVWLMITDPQSEYTAYLTNQLDVTYGLPFPDVPQIRERTPEHLQVEPMIGIYYVGFNHSRPPFDDVRVRRAFVLVMDRGLITQEVTEGLRQPANSWVPAGVKDADGATDFCEVTGNMFPDPTAESTIEEACQLLAEAGYPNGQGFPEVTYLYNTHDDHQRVAERLQNLWQNTLGVRVNLQNQEWQVYLANRRTGNYQFARGGWIGDYSDPMTFLHIWMTGDGQNRSGYSVSEYDSLLHEAMHTANRETYFDLCHRAERVLMDTVAAGPIWYYSNVFLQNPALLDLNVTPSGDVLFHRVRWDLDRLRAEGVEVGG